MTTTYQIEHRLGRLAAVANDTQQLIGQANRGELTTQQAVDRIVFLMRREVVVNSPPTPPKHRPKRSDPQKSLDEHHPLATID